MRFLEFLQFLFGDEISADVRSILGHNQLPFDATLDIQSYLVRMGVWDPPQNLLNIWRASGFRTSILTRYDWRILDV